MAENPSPNTPCELMIDSKLQIQEPENIRDNIPKNSTARYIISKLKKTKDKEKILNKIRREKPKLPIEEER